MEISFFWGGLIGGFILSIIANLFSDKIKDWLSRLSLISKEKRLKNLISDLEHMDRFYKNKNSFYLHIARVLLVTILNIYPLLFAILMIVASPSIIAIDKDIQKYMNTYLVVNGNQYNYLVFSIVILSMVSLVVVINGIFECIKKINFFIDYQKNRQILEERIALLSSNEKISK